MLLLLETRGGATLFYEQGFSRGIGRLRAGALIPAGDSLVLFGGGGFDAQHPAFGGAQAALDMGFWVSLLSVIAIIYGAFVAMAQTDCTLRA